jgi:hypothetical protein
MITLYELAAYNAAKKNKTRRITETHKDVLAFIFVSDFLFTIRHCKDIVIMPTYRNFLTNE